MNRRTFVAAAILAALPWPLAAQQGSRISADQAAAIAARRTGGQVLSVTWDASRNRYRVKVLESGGRVRTVDVDGGGD